MPKVKPLLPTCCSLLCVSRVQFIINIRTKPWCTIIQNHCIVQSVEVIPFACLMPALRHFVWQRLIHNDDCCMIRVSAAPASFTAAVVVVCIWYIYMIRYRLKCAVRSLSGVYSYRLQTEQQTTHHTTTTTPTPISVGKGAEGIKHPSHPFLSPPRCTATTYLTYLYITCKIPHNNGR